MSEIGRPPIDEILFEAVQRSSEARIAYLDEACAGDDALRREVESLLAAEASVGDFLEKPPELASGLWAALEDDRAGADAASAEDPWIGRQLGAWRITDRLGAGGMGAVYRAERADAEFEKTVAVKLIKRGMDTDEILDRFRRERQVLAGLEHPNIARLLDGGSTEEGLPYLVLELVEGRPFDRYCAEEELPLEARLELFEQVCRAVQAAHQNLVIHRDLKPGNILVDDSGRVKLLDFGIAKLLEPEPEPEADGDGDGDGTTRLGLRILTPDWASPEQLRGERVTTASDVYALGLVLLRVLCGLEASPEHRMTSFLASRHVGDVPGVRGEDRRRWSRRLEGDLDTILQVALRSEPERRYPTAERFAEDLRRHREGLPVTARPDTLGYRVSKFVRRHAATVALATLLALGLAAAALVSTLLYLDAESARRAETEARQAAETERETAEAVATFLEDILAAGDPVLTQRSADVTVREVLDEAAGRLGEDLADRPAVAWRLLSTVGASYTSLGELEEAESALRTAVELQQEAGAEPGPRAEVLTALGAALRSSGRPDEALETLRRAKGLLETSGAPGPGALGARVDRLIASTLRDRGDLEESQLSFESALGALDAPKGPAAEEELAKVRHDFGLLLQQLGRDDRAAEMVSASLADFERLLGPGHSYVAQTLNDLAWIEMARDRDEEALGLLRRALEIYQELYEGAHPKVAIARTNLGNALRGLGRAEDAVLEIQAALPLFEEALGGDHPYVGHTLNNLGLALQEAGRLEEARERFRAAARVYRGQLGPDHPHLAIALQNEALAWEADDRPDRALDRARKALDIRRRALASDHPDLARSLQTVGRLALETGRVAEARAHLREAAEATPGEPDAELAALLAEAASTPG